MSEFSIPIFSCQCKRKKSYSLTLDGGSSGKYQLQLCKSCYQNEDKKFVISEEVLL